ncbi:MAG: TonB-dependent receptor [Pseudomonadota bacterium]
MRKWVLSAGAAMLVSSSLLGTAQTPEDEDEVTLDKIIVKGTKQETTLQDADVAVTVIGREALKAARVTDIRRIDDLAPNVQFNDSSPLGAVYISIRGVESNPFIVNRAAVYIDGIPFRELNNSVLTQLDSVEVLRGPQSTLYGANTETGLIVINTRPPSAEFTANTSLTATSFETGEAYTGEGYVAGPIAPDALTGSLAVRYSDRDYFLENIGATPQGPGQIDELFVQGRLRWTPTDRLTVNVTAYIIDTDAPGIYRFDGFPVDLDRYNEIYSDGALFDPTNPFSPPPVNGTTRATDFQFVHDAPKRAEIEEFVGGLSANYDTGFGDLDLSFSHRTEDIDDRGFDIDNTNAPFLAGTQIDTKDLVNAEVRFTSPSDRALIYSIGASLYSEEATLVLGSLVGPGGLNDFNFSPEQAVKSDDLGLFGSVSYSPQSLPGLTGTIGLRYDEAQRETTQQAGELDLGFAVFLFDDLQLEETFDAVLPRFALRYEPSDTLTLYANIAKGYLPGGFNLTAAQDGFQDDVIRYESEELWSYEAGLKWQSPDASAFLAGAIFFVDAENYQEIAALLDEAGNVVSTSFIGSDAAIESYGFEIEGQWTPTDQLLLTGNLGVVNSEYTDFGRGEASEVIGNPVKLVPEYDANLAARYEFESGLFVRGEINFIGETALDEGNRTGFTANAVDAQGAVEMLSLQLGYETDQWAVRLFGENLTDERRISGGGFPNAFFPTDGLLYGAIDSPRVIGVELSASY